jgi:hypothetical protein
MSYVIDILPAAAKYFIIFNVFHFRAQREKWNTRKEKYRF